MCARMLAEAGTVAGEQQRRSEGLGGWNRRDAPSGASEGKGDD